MVQIFGRFASVGFNGSYIAEMLCLSRHCWGGTKAGWKVLGGG